jgi:hypothetical protein
MSQHIFQLESELQNIPEAAPKASPNFSVSERLARYGSSALSGVEHLTLLVGKESIACVLIRHFGSLKALSRASFVELRQFLPQSKAEAVIAALSLFTAGMNMQPRLFVLFGELLCLLRTARIKLG